MSKMLCIYHGNCADGFTAAWVVRKAMGEAFVEFHPGVYQDPAPDVTGRHVLLVDFSYKRPVLEEMAKVAASITILDHHKSAIEDLAGLPIPRDFHDWEGMCPVQPGDPTITAFFDMERSGAGITWDFFNPGDPRPEIVNIVEDRDLWRFKMPYTRSVMTCIFSHPYDFQTWDFLANKCDNHMSLQDMMIEGDAIDRKHFKDIDELLAVCQRKMMIGGYQVPVASLPYTMSSDAAHKMAEGRDFAACYWDTPISRVFSLRSAEHGLDVSKIAAEYGGGGHEKAAGFAVPRDHPLAQE